MDKVYVLYHDNCYDGFGAAWVFRKFQVELFGNRDVIYIGVSYGSPPPKMDDGSTVFIVDFSYNRETTLELKSRMANLLVLDHHRTAEQELIGLDFVKLDMHKSGAILAWEHCAPIGQTYEPPTLLRYVQDYDLWTKGLPETDEVNAYIRSQPMDMDVWDTLATMLNSADGFDRCVLYGQVVLRTHKQLIDAQASQAVFVKFMGYTAPMVNASVLFSQTQQRLREKYPEIPFALYYFDRADGRRQWGISSGEGGIDVSHMAKQMGGGGHKGAAGFITERNWLPGQ